MKRLVVLLMTLALCLPMFMTTSIEVRAEIEGGGETGGEVTNGEVTNGEVTYPCFHFECAENGGTAVEANALCTSCKSSGQEGTVVTKTKEGAQEGWHNIIETCPHCGSELRTNAEPCSYDGGSCVCGRIKPSKACAHVAYCGGDSISDSATYCDYCLGVEWTEIWGMPMDCSTHYKLKQCRCTAMEEVAGTEGEHTFNESGFCSVCNYNPSCPPSTEPPSVPNVSEGPVVNAPTAVEIHAQKAAEAEARQKKVVTTASGEAVKTEIAGVYEVNSLNGTAVTTKKEDVKRAIGLSEEEIKAGTKASIYMTDYVKKADREALNKAAVSNGKKVLNMVISDMYSITKDGKITKLHSSKEPISLMFGVPKNAVKADRIYSVICVAVDGSVVELKDTDNDPSTITVDTTVFGKYAIVY